jgi:HEAT repeat protein
LLDALHDGDGLTRLHAITALGVIARAPRAAVPALTEALRSNDIVAGVPIPNLIPDAVDVHVAMAAAAALGKFGPAALGAVPELIKRLTDPCASVREEAARALGNIGPAASAAVPALIDALKGDGSREPSNSAIEALAQINAETAVSVLIEVLRHPDLDRRWTAAAALGALGPQAAAAIPDLLRARIDSNPDLREAIDQAIESISPTPDSPEMDEVS